jgi:hypothetical protein
VLWFSRDPVLAHAFGTFTATFLYAVAALGSVDPAGAPGRVPLISTVMMFALLLASVAMFDRRSRRGHLGHGRGIDAGRACVRRAHPD